MIRTITAAAAIGLAVGLSPPLAHADETSYLSYLHNLHIGRPRDDQATLYLGHLACSGLASGMDDGEVVTMLRSRAAISSDTAGKILLYAPVELCGGR
jgi:hypothetical protein